MKYPARRLPVVKEPCMHMIKDNQHDIIHSWQKFHIELLTCTMTDLLTWPRHRILGSTKSLGCLSSNLCIGCHRLQTQHHGLQLPRCTSTFEYGPSSLALLSIIMRYCNLGYYLTKLHTNYRLNLKESIDLGKKRSTLLRDLCLPIKNHVKQRRHVVQLQKSLLFYTFMGGP